MTALALRALLMLAWFWPTSPHDSHAVLDSTSPAVHHHVAPRPRPTPEQSWLSSRAARCVKRAESGGNYRSGGAEPHGGAWQFADTTWWGIGGKGLAWNATPAEQDHRAYLLWRAYGWGQWQTAPGCGV